MRKRGKAAAAAAILCLTAVLGARPAFADANLASADGVYGVTLPEGYEDLRGQLDPEGDEQEFLLVAGHGGSDPVYVISNSELKTGGTVSLLADYASILGEGIKASDLFKNVSDVTADGSFAIDRDMPAVKMKFSAEYGSFPIEYYIYAIEGARSFYQFCAWTTADNAKAEEELDAMVRSFAILSSAPSAGEAEEEAEKMSGVSGGGEANPVGSPDFAG